MSKRDIPNCRKGDDTTSGNSQALHELLHLVKLNSTLHIYLYDFQMLEMHPHCDIFLGSQKDSGMCFQRSIPQVPPIQ